MTLSSLIWCSVTVSDGCAEAETQIEISEHRNIDKGKANTNQIITHEVIKLWHEIVAFIVFVLIFHHHTQHIHGEPWCLVLSHEDCQTYKICICYSNSLSFGTQRHSAFYQCSIVQHTNQLLYILYKKPITLTFILLQISVQVIQCEKIWLENKTQVSLLHP